MRLLRTIHSFSALALSDCLSEIGTDPSANSMDPSLARNTPPGHCRVQVPQLIHRCLLMTKRSEIASVGHVRIAGQSEWFRHLSLSTRITLSVPSQICP